MSRGKKSIPRNIAHHFVWNDRSLMNISGKDKCRKQLSFISRVVVWHFNFYIPFLVHEIFKTSFDNTNTFFITYLILFFFSVSVEAVHLANLLCQFGYYFPIGELKNLLVKDDSSLYRFQSPYYWPSQHHSPDNIEYAIYLAKR